MGNSVPYSVKAPNSRSLRCYEGLGIIIAAPYLGSISAAFSSLVYVPPREEFGGGAQTPFTNSGW